MSTRVLIRQLRCDELIRETRFLCEPDKRNEERRRAVLVDIIISNQQGPYSRCVPGDKKLSDKTAAVVGDQIDRFIER
jgi:hypothetical protein